MNAECEQLHNTLDMQLISIEIFQINVLSSPPESHTYIYFIDEETCT